ncbi:transcriptional repressor LexA [Candidatus Peregrinibacteria bacterium]|nr:transcriptional repressor LexA [Candidatus Peregrinibacteria bacterium]
MNEILTEKQEALLNFIEEYQMQNGGSPTIREMKEYFGVSSDNSILKHLKALEEKGKILKEDGARGIKMLNSVKDKINRGSFSLPLLGTVPAGNPVLAEESVDERLNIGEDLVFDVNSSFLLKVTGDSMIDVGIYSDDIVVVAQNLTPRLGDIVVALVDNQSTVKTYMNDGERVYLKPENSNYENIYPENELCIQGVVTGLIRYYKR